MPLIGEYEPSAAEWARTQAEKYEESNGSEANELRGRPIVVMTSIGAKSGKLRKTPIMRVEHEGEYAVFASKGGDEKNPTWYWNVKANPHVELQDGAEKKDYLAHVATGAEREAWWQRGVATWPDYAHYATKTDREIPVFVLTEFTP